MSWEYDQALEVLTVYCDRCLIATNKYEYFTRKKAFELMKKDGFKFVTIRGQFRLLCAKCLIEKKLKDRNDQRL